MLDGTTASNRVQMHFIESNNDKNYPIRGPLYAHLVGALAVPLANSYDVIRAIFVGLGDIFGKISIGLTLPFVNLVMVLCEKDGYKNPCSIWRGVHSLGHAVLHGVEVPRSFITNLIDPNWSIVNSSDIQKKVLEQEDSLTELRLSVEGCRKEIGTLTQQRDQLTIEKAQLEQTVRELNDKSGVDDNIIGSLRTEIQTLTNEINERDALIIDLHRTNEALTAQIELMDGEVENLSRERDNLSNDNQRKEEELRTIRDEINSVFPAGEVEEDPIARFLKYRKAKEDQIMGLARNNITVTNEKSSEIDRLMEENLRLRQQLEASQNAGLGSAAHEEVKNAENSGKSLLDQIKNPNIKLRKAQEPRQVKGPEGKNEVPTAPLDAKDNVWKALGDKIPVKQDSRKPEKKNEEPIEPVSSHVADLQGKYEVSKIKEKVDVVADFMEHLDWSDTDVTKEDIERYIDQHELNPMHFQSIFMVAETAPNLGDFRKKVEEKHNTAKQKFDDLMKHQLQVFEELKVVQQEKAAIEQQKLAIEQQKLAIEEKENQRNRELLLMMAETKEAGLAIIATTNILDKEDGQVENSEDGGSIEINKADVAETENTQEEPVSNIKRLAAIWGGAGTDAFRAQALNITKRNKNKN